jgi:hypothetical protein
MGSIDKYSFRTTLASLALIPVSVAGVLRIARRISRALRGFDSMTGHGWMILTLPGFDGRMIPALATGESNARRPRLLRRRAA